MFEGNIVVNSLHSGCCGLDVDGFAVVAGSRHWPDIVKCYAHLMYFSLKSYRTYDSRFDWGFVRRFFCLSYGHRVCPRGLFSGRAQQRTRRTMI